MIVRINNQNNHTHKEEMAQYQLIECCKFIKTMGSESFGFCAYDINGNTVANFSHDTQTNNT
jgi:hypothetical protein